MLAKQKGVCLALKNQSQVDLYRDVVPKLGGGQQPRRPYFDMPSPSPLSGMTPSEGPPGLILEDGQAHMKEGGPLGNQVLSFPTDPCAK